MEELNAFLSTPATPATLCVLFGFLVFIGKLVPEKTVRKLEESWELSLTREQDLNAALLETVKTLTKQTETAVTVLEKLPKVEEKGTKKMTYLKKKRERISRAEEAVMLSEQKARKQEKIIRHANHVAHRIEKRRFENHFAQGIRLAFEAERRNNHA